MLRLLLAASLLTLHVGLAAPGRATAVSASPAASPLLTATLRDSLLVDADSSGSASPGDTLQYTAVISNPGTIGATGVVYTTSLDSNTTLVSGSLQSTPLAFENSATTTEDTAVLLTLQGGEFDGDSLTFNTVSGPDHGSLGGYTATSTTSATVRYTPAANYNGSDDFTFQVADDDGNTDSAMVRLTVTAVNDPPVLDLNGAAAGSNSSATFTEGGGPVTIVQPGLTLTDVEGNTIISATVTLTALPDGTAETLSATTTGTSISAGYSSATGVLTLTGPDTVANFQQVLRTVTYDNSSSTPNTAARTATFIASDGDSSSPVTSTITIVPVNSAPVLDLNGAAAGRDYAATYTEGAPQVIVAAASLTVTDSDNPTLASATITLTNPLDGTAELLSATVGATGISASYNSATGILSLTGSSSVANYQQVLRTVTYDNSSDNPTTTDRSVTFVVSDDTDSSSVATSTVAITAVDDPPSLDLNGSNDAGTGFSAAFTEGDGPTAIVDADLSLTDPDSTSLTSATITITNQLDDTAELLSATVGATGISAVYNSATGILSLTGSSSLTNYQQVLRTVTYDNSSKAPDTTTRAIAFQVTGGSVSSAVVTASVTINGVNSAPLLDLDADNSSGTTGSSYQTTFTENDGPVTIGDAVDLTISDDSVNLVSATITLTNLLDGTAELLSATVGATGISAGYNSATGILSLTGTSSLANYQQVLRSATYENSSNDPDTTSRVLNVVVNDGEFSSNTAVATITVVAVNDPPTVTGESYSDVIGNTRYAVGATPTGPAVTKTGSLLTNDDDGGDGPGALSITAFQNPSAQGGIVDVAANGSFTYTPPVGVTGSDTFTYTVSDGADTADGTVTLTIGSMVWYVDNTAAAGGDGRSHAPFNTLAGVNGAGGAGDSDDAGHIIFVHSGSGAYTGGLPLENTQQLTGEGVALVVSGQTLVSAGTPPTLNGGVTLAQSNTLSGLTLGSATPHALSGSSFTAVTISDVTINNSSGGGLDLDSGSLNVTLSSVTTGGANTGIEVTNASGSLTVSSATTINNSSGTGVNLANNGMATFNFNNLAITNSGGTGLNASSSGTLNVSGASSTVNTTTGTAVALINTAIGGSGITFQSVSASGGSTGISLNNTGSSGSFTVTGATSAGSGGTLSGHSAEGIYLNDVPGGAAFTNMIIDQSATSSTQGIDATTVTGLSLTDTTITAGSNNSYALRGTTITNMTTNNTIFDGGGGSVPSIDGVRLTNLLGTSSFTNSTFRNGKDINLLIENNTTSGSQDTLTISGTTFTNSAGGDHLQVGISSSGNMKLVVNGSSTFSGTGQDGMQLESEGNATFEAIVTAVSISGNLGSAVNLAAAGTATLIAHVHDLTGLSSGGSNVLNAINFDTSTLEVTFENNTINLGSNSFNGIRTIHEGNGTLTARIHNNAISGPGREYGIRIQPRSGSGTLNATVTNNNVTLSGNTLSLDGIGIEAGSSSGSDTNTICLNLANNSSSAVNFFDGYYLRHRAGTTFRLQDFTGNGANSGDVTTWVNTTKSNTGSVSVNGTGFTAAPTDCPTPTVPTTSLPTAALSTTGPTAVTNGPDIFVNIGTLPGGKAVTLTYAATVNDPFPDGVEQVSSQGIVTADDIPTTPTDDPDTAAAPDATITPISRQQFLYLPLVMNNYAALPDLVITDLDVSSSGVVVTLENQGVTAVTDAFWVDVYLDPAPMPTAVNQTWDQLATEGLVWGVTAAALPLNPGDSLTLRIADAYYVPALSSFGGVIGADTAVYAQVDSAAAGSSYGAILETHEQTGSAYNNIAGPVQPTP